MSKSIPLTVMNRSSWLSRTQTSVHSPKLVHTYKKDAAALLHDGCVTVRMLSLQHKELVILTNPSTAEPWQRKAPLFFWNTMILNTAFNCFRHFMFRSETTSIIFPNSYVKHSLVWKVNSFLLAFCISANIFWCCSCTALA